MGPCVRRTAGMYLHWRILPRQEGHACMKQQVVRSYQCSGAEGQAGKANACSWWAHGWGCLSPRVGAAEARAAAGQAPGSRWEMLPGYLQGQAPASAACCPCPPHPPCLPLLFPSLPAVQQASSLWVTQLGF